MKQPAGTLERRVFFFVILIDKIAKLCIYDLWIIISFIIISGSN